MSATYPLTADQLATVRVLYLAEDTLRLFGIPYPMRADIGQQPADISRHGSDRPEWLDLGTSGRRTTTVQAWLDALPAGCLPEWPCEWSDLTMWTT